MGWLVHPHRLQRALLRRAASQYARHGWPVVPGAYPSGARFLCDRAGCPTSGCHPAFEDWQGAASHDPVAIARWWSLRSHSVLLPTGIAFDVIDTPERLGAPAVRLLYDSQVATPVAVTPTGRWMFFVRHGDGLRPELAEQLHVLLHAGNSWVPAPPTRYPEGRVYWQVSPGSVGWQLPDTYRVQRALTEAAQLGGLVTGPPVRYDRPPLNGRDHGLAGIRRSA